MQRTSLIKNFLKGIVIGIGKIIPGVSGAVLALSMGIYDKSIYYLNNLTKNIKESLKYLVPIALGILLGIILFSKVINYFLSNYYLPTMLFFIGLIIGGIPLISKNVSKKDYLFTAITFVIFFTISITNISNNYLLKNNFLDIFTFIFTGFLEAIGTVVPGISSTALLMIIGTYEYIISSLGNIFNISLLIPHLKILVPFTFGLIIGIIITVKIIDILFQKNKSKVYSFILGILLSSIVLLVVRAFKTKVSLVELLVGLILMIGGIFLSNIMEEK